MNRRSALLIAGVVIAILALGVVLAATYATSGHPSSLVLSSSKCHSINGLPDPACTPGGIDSRVNQNNIATTICVSGYTATVRPATAYTNALKRVQIVEYGYVDKNPAHYEEDHLIPLELGGSPTNPKNLWPEPLAGNNSAKQKDVLEDSLHDTVCSGLMTLAAAQSLIARNWESG